MKFAHIADVHIGAWKNPDMDALSRNAFTTCIDSCIFEEVDFVLICGDLFDTALPGIDNIKFVVSELKKFWSKKIPVYIIAGSHDFSPSGKTMLDVLEEAGLVINVVRGSISEDKMLKLNFTTDKKTGVKLAGLIGKKGMLEKKYYEALDHESLSLEEGAKIFMFHTSINELKTKELEMMDGISATFMPSGFNYYAGGHVHIINSVSLDGYPMIRYPGPVFPVTFSELEKLGAGNFSIVSLDSGEISIKDMPLEMKRVVSIGVDVKTMTPENAFDKIISLIENTNVKDSIVLLRIFGKLSDGHGSDIDFHAIFEKLYSLGAYHVLRNTIKLSSSEFEEIKKDVSCIEDIESDLIMEHAGQIGLPGKSRDDEIRLSQELLRLLNSSRSEGEKVASYEEKVKKELDLILEL